MTMIGYICEDYDTHLSKHKAEVTGMPVLPVHKMNSKPSGKTNVARYLPF